MPTIYDVPSVYATIGAATAALPSNVAGLGEHRIVVETGLYAESVLINPSGTTKDVDFASLVPKSGDETLGVIGSGVVIAPIGTALAMSTAAHVKVRDIEIQSTKFSGAFFSGTENKIDRVLLVTNTTSSRGFRLGLDNEVNGCIAYKSTSGATNNSIGFFGAGTGNVTTDCVSYGYDQQFHSLEAHNCVAANGERFAFQNCTGDYNASHIDISNYPATGTGSLPGLTTLEMGFTDPVNGDFSLQPGSVFHSAGRDELVNFPVDIKLRPTVSGFFPMGAFFDEVLPSSGGVGGGQLSLGLFLKL